MPAAGRAASNKMANYDGLSSQGEFVPIAVEAHGQSIFVNEKYLT